VLLCCVSQSALLSSPPATAEALRQRRSVDGDSSDGDTPARDRPVRRRPQRGGGGVGAPGGVAGAGSAPAGGGGGDGVASSLPSIHRSRPVGASRSISPDVTVISAVSSALTAAQGSQSPSAGDRDRQAVRERSAVIGRVFGAAIEEKLLSGNWRLREVCDVLCVVCVLCVLCVCCVVCVTVCDCV
jgi:hypothetical protein